MTDIIVQFGSTESERVAVFDMGTLRFDNSNKSLRIHDGQRKGGFELLPLQVLSLSFQAKAAELTALSSLPESGIGFQVRTGAAQYRFVTLRESANIAVANGSGVAGQISFSLKGEITTTHTFSELTQFQSGIEGNVTGNLTGDVTGNVTGNLKGDSNGTHTGPVVGSLDATDGEILVDSGALPIDAISGLPETLAAITSIPFGLISLWSGSHDSIPSGWVLCNGQQSTPDLRGRFIVAASDSIPVGSTGGTTSHNHVVAMESAGEHSHEVSVASHVLTEQQIPRHRHTNGVVDKNDTLFNKGSLPANPSRNDSIDGNSSNGVVEGYTSFTGGGQGHAHGASSESAGTHTHAISAEGADNIPPYYALCYIMFIGQPN